MIEADNERATATPTTGRSASRQRKLGATAQALRRSLTIWSDNDSRHGRHQRFPPEVKIADDTADPEAARTTGRALTTVPRDDLNAAGEVIRPAARPKPEKMQREIYIRETTMSKITTTTTVSQLRSEHSDYTIARMLAERLGVKDKLPKMLEKDYPYTVARKLLGRVQKSLKAKKAAK